MGNNNGSMLAAVAHKGEYQFRLEQIAIPKIETGDVLVKVEAVGISRGLVAMWQFTDLFNLLPGVLGHEIAGTVAEVGRGVNSFQAGDRVRVHTTLTCGSCIHCRNNQESLCHSRYIIGHGTSDDIRSLHQHYRHGGMAQYVKVPASSLDPVDDSISDNVAARVGTIALSLRALHMVEAKFGDRLVITGASGASGASTARCASLLGFTTICGVATYRQGLERLVGAGGLTHFIATSELPNDWEEKNLLTPAILETTATGGVDAVIDFMPFGQAVTTQSIHSMRPGGHAVLAGGNISELNLSYIEVMRNQYQLKGLRGAVHCYDREVLSLLEAKHLQMSDLVTHTFRLEEANRALETVMGREGSPVFVVITPWA